MVRLRNAQWLFIMPNNLSLMNMKKQYLFEFCKALEIPPTPIKDRRQCKALTYCHIVQTGE